MNLIPETAAQKLDRVAEEVRPKLHRYCARMTGSVIDGEDVLQDALTKAVSALSRNEDVANIEGWLFRIAHNAALDFLRRRARNEIATENEEFATLVEPSSEIEERQIVETSLRTFMHLPLAQRSAVILMDVLGYHLEEIGHIMGTTVPAVKAALHRGRLRLRELADQPEDYAEPQLDERQRRLLERYVDRFNAHDFDAIRRMIAGEIQVELVSQTRLHGARAANYFTNYAGKDDWFLRAGAVDGRLAVVVCAPDTPDTPAYFILLESIDGALTYIRDFRYARYAIEGADIQLF